MQFAKQRLLGCFTDFYAALRKLPTLILDAARPQHLATRAGKNNPHAGAKAFTVYCFLDALHGAPGSRTNVSQYKAG